jgi:hypothetical protein
LSCSGTTAAPAAALSEAPAQSRLGRLPKNARLIEAMAQHKNAKPKPKGWLMAVVESIYKEGAALAVTLMQLVLCAVTCSCPCVDSRRMSGALLWVKLPVVLQLQWCITRAGLELMWLLLLLRLLCCCC